MFVLNARFQRYAFFALAALMAATRVHHFGVGTIAPDASTAVFFLGGLLLANPLWFLAFVLEAIVLDAFAIGIVSVADACMTLGYWLLFAGYFALWYAGRLGRGIGRLDLAAGAHLLCLCAGGVAAFFIISNVGYYFGGGFHESMGAAEYAARVSRYFGRYLTVTLAYSAAGIAVLLAARRLAAHATPSRS
jgi:hypothetical protein